MLPVFGKRRRTAFWAALSLAVGAGRAVVAGWLPGSAEVTLADGSRRELRDIHEGDLVASWDESLQRPAVSAVKAVLEFDRDGSELVEVSLPGASLDATVDHPFWSQVRGSLVSFSPRATRGEYGPDAELAGPAEELDGELQEAVPATLARRFPAAAPGESLADPAGVMTLCLRPHRWFYAEGARVHGEFAREKGTQRPLAELRDGDGVASWSNERCAASVAEVPGLDEWPAGELTESEPRRLADGRRRRVTTTTTRRRTSASTSSTSSSGGSVDTGVIIAIVVVIVVIGVMVVCFWAYQQKQKEQQKEAEAALQAAAQPDAEPAEDSNATPMQDNGQYDDSSAAPVPVVVGQVVEAVPGELQVVEAVPGEIEQNAVPTDARGLLA